MVWRINRDGRVVSCEYYNCLSKASLRSLLIHWRSWSVAMGVFRDGWAHSLLHDTYALICGCCAYIFILILLPAGGGGARQERVRRGAASAAGGAPRKPEPVPRHAGRGAAAAKAHGAAGRAQHLRVAHRHFPGGAAKGLERLWVFQRRLRGGVAYAWKCSTKSRRRGSD